MIITIILIFVWFIFRSFFVEEKKTNDDIYNEMLSKQFFN